MKKIGFLFILILSASYLINAQQLPQFRYQEFNSIFLNPAYIGKTNSPNIYLNHRSQWVGFSGAPTITSLAGKYNFREDMAGGIIISNDLTGPTRRTYFNLNYAYTLKTDMFNINFGLAWNLTNYRIRGDLITIHEQNDLSIIQNMNDGAWKPDANMGIMISSEKLYAGIGIQQLFKSKFKFYESNNNFGNIQSTRHFFINGGYHIATTYNEGVITPQLNLYFAKGTPFKMDIILNYLHQNKLSVSLMLTTLDAFVIQIGYHYNQFVINYSYDIVISRIRNASSGSHEIGLAMYLKEKDNSISSPSF